MKVIFNKPFKDYKGNDVVAGGKPVMISDEIGRILFGLSTSGNVPLNADEKYLAYKLCSRISGTDEAIDITAEEGAFIVKVCGEMLTAGAYGQIRDLING